MDNATTAKKYAEALESKDLHATARLLDPNVVVHYPQSGEVFRGRDNYITMLSNHPGLPEANVPKVSGDSGSVHVSTSVPFGMPIVSIAGSGDVWIVEGSVEYGDGSRFDVVAVLEMSDGLVVEETWYWAAPFEAPSWRLPYVSE